MEHKFDPREVAQFEHDTWSRCSVGYVEGFGALTNDAIASLLDAAAVDSGTRVLDVGTGPGMAAAAAAERGADVTGVDFSETMIAEAARRHPDIQVEKSAAESLPFDEGSFDAVVGNFVLHHSGRPDAVLSEAYRVLERDGKAAFTVWADLSKLDAFNLFFGAVEEHAGSAELPHGPLFGISDFAVFHQMARDAGFRDSSVEELPLAWRTDSLDPLVASFHDWGNLAAFPADVRDRIESSVREGAERYRSGDGFVMPNPAILIAAVK